MSFVTRQRAGAVLISVIVSAASLALTVPVSAATVPAATVPAATGASQARSGHSSPTGLAPDGAVLTRRACPVPSEPGVAACDVIVRTDAVVRRQGKLAPDVAPQGYGPAELQSAYQLPSATAGAGATVAIVDAYDDPTAAADLAVYRQRYGLPACPAATGCFRKIDQAGGTAYPPHDLSWATEISLDLDMVSAACPNCRILLVEADSAGFSDLGAAVNEAVRQGAKYVSNSYGGAFDPAASQAQDAQYYNHPGVVVTASSGDEGFTPDAQFPADSPHVVAVGGTSLMRDPSRPRGWTETAWSGAGSGCGPFLNPSWQGPGVACDNGGGQPLERSYSDVSAVADPLTGVAVYDTFGLAGWQVFGGTSAASPLIAATYALAGKPAGGSYPAARLYAGHAALNDVTSGSNGSGGCGVLCTAGRGWDGPTGWGTPDGVADFTAGPHGTVSGAVTGTDGAPVAGAQVMIGNATAITDRAGRYATTALDGSYPPSASRYGYSSQTAAPVTVTTGGTTTQDFTLARLPMATVTGTVHDASGHGWPLYAEITVPGTPVTAYTSPVTGRYSLSLPAGQPFTLHVSAQLPGYLASDNPVTPDAHGLTQDIGLAADGTNCPAGYHEAVNGLTQGFGSRAAPAGWTVSGSGMSWQFANPGQRNVTGGTGGYALAAGLGNTTMTSPVFNLSTATAPVLKFDQDLAFGPSEALAGIQISTDGGQSWFPVESLDDVSASSVPGPDTQVLPLPQAAGQSQVQLRFYTEFFSPSMWEIDDVTAGDLSCRAVPGGLVTGIVHDANTGQPVSGATVSGGGQQVTTSPEPGDPAVGGGLYELFAPAGPLALTAAAAGYSPGAANVTVTAGAVTQAGFTLAAGRLAVSPGTVSVTEPMGGSKTATVKVTNTGGAPVTIAPAAQAGPVTLAGQGGRFGPAGLGKGPAAGAGAPLQRLAGHFSPAPGLAAADGALRQRLAAARRRAGASATGPGSWVPPWTSVAHYPDYGYDMTAATDPVTGQVYVVGGVTGGDVSGASPHGYVYDPATGAWSQLPDMPAGRSAAAAAVIGGRLYVTGGYLADGTLAASLDVYDPHTGLWSQRAPIPHAYYGSGTATLGGKLYVVGGCRYDSGGGALCNSTAVQVYDPATDSWRTAAAYPLGISFLGCGAISGKLYCAGGFAHKLQRGTTAAYAYDPAAGTWTQVASMPIDLWGGASAAANGQLLMSGGITRFDQVATNQGFAYDPVANAWSPLPNAPDAAYRVASACGFYSIGGIDQAGSGLSASAAQLPGYTGCDGGAGPGWLSQTPAQATLAPGRSATLTLTLTAGPAQVSQPGTYTATLAVNSGAPYLAPRVPVTLTATPPTSWGELTGVINGRDCDGTVSPLDNATVQVNSAAGGWTLTTGPDGRYVLWRPAGDSPLSLIVTAGHWLAKTVTARLKAGAVATASVTLTRPSCG
ncbi:MAG TPA: carboxypeptidase regulatory-like domain-containing protein [Streptosporangiaceae bacterium]